ncbi:MAG: DegT/DnrJ/EryC1/StrS family aminotransferase [Planctomycetota bacterium]
MTTATPSAKGALAIDGGSPVADSPVPFMAVGLSADDIALATEVLESGMLRAASKCAALEEQFAGKSSAAHALTCANGTCALQLAYGALLEPGDEVICPAWTYVATASMLVAQGCRVVFCDSLDTSYQIDPGDVRKRITPNTKAIAATHIYGIPVDINAIQAIAKEHDLKVIYDCAQAHLATYDAPDGTTHGIGAYGDACTYSFYATKNLGTGEGGIITVNSDDLATDIALLRSHGEPEKYLHTRIGFNYRMNDITGAIGLSKLQRLGEETDRRRAVAKAYHERFDAIEGIARPHPTAGSNPAWHLYTLRPEAGAFTRDRDGFIEALKAEGIPCAIHYPKSLTDQPAFAEAVDRNARDFGDEHPPVARRLAQTVFSIPMHQNLTEAQIDAVATAVAKVADASRA